ncbi:NAD(P)H-dependent FMN reductase LOT6 [Ceratocystis platani]|uniref:NAD(P)H-dependent FMN reductase LOT6 n=1 Tax=Ceratocystis fimbriata f. sp. platani TaxID=88771 RepID=A0A0F8AWW5_CERFI|nr:NAD(P)H-dependent FMN reductase LOT6 [Ceratocystis platani]
MTKLFNIGIISGSQRQIQVGSQITDWVQGIIEKHLGHGSAIGLRQISIKDLDLPLYDEPYPPSQITSSDQYTKETTRAWSRIVAPLDAFVIVTPEYNVNVPAGLKNALDLLYFEWTNKPFFIISYGGMGGTFAYDNLKRSLSFAIKARVVETRLNLAFGPSQNGIAAKAVAGQDLGLSVTDDETLWADKRGDVTKGWDELIGLLNSKSAE